MKAPMTTLMSGLIIINWSPRNSGPFHRSTGIIRGRTMEVAILIGMGMKRRRKRSFTHREDLQAVEKAPAGLEEVFLLLLPVLMQKVLNLRARIRLPLQLLLLGLILSVFLRQ